MGAAYLFAMEFASFTAPLVVENRLTGTAAGGIRLGLVRADGVAPDVVLSALDDAITALDPDLDVLHEARRLAARDMLRNGTYKPTGRGKPASEYLLRAVREKTFPRINALVDINNLISASSALPISLWDLDRAAAARFVFRLGAEGEVYVFNASGQTLGVRDLAVGCRVGEEETPIVSPVKDCHATKTTPETRRIAASIYAPAEAVSHADLDALCATFAGWLSRCGDARTTTAVAEPGETVEL